LAVEKSVADQKLENIIFLSTKNADSKLGDEGYQLEVKPAKITISANKEAGLFYGVQTLLQLLPAEIYKSSVQADFAWEIPAVLIKDKPVFQWRGAHLDVCRHYFPVEFVKKYIDILAMHKLNVFHWHLTEDQGWRIEIKKYPKLSTISSKRKETSGRKGAHPDGIPHGGIYTQDEVREIVEYAHKRFITVVPEIEMPGHALAALAAYPKLSCTGGPFEVGTRWGVYEDVYCAGNEKTFKFLEDVLTEVIPLFPGEFFHVGGDECPKARWEECSKCQKRIKAKNLKDEHELQSYFIQRMEKFLNAKGKRLIGWDEILEGGLAPNAAVMSWRGMKGGIEAANAGHDVVMSPTGFCYFDYYQARFNEPEAIGGYLPLEKVYSFKLIPPDISPDKKKHIIGGQANLWTEYIPTTDKAEYMLLPRVSALAEVVWTEDQLRNFDNFKNRLSGHFDRLTFMGVNFRVPTPIDIDSIVVAGADTLIQLDVFPNTRVYYTLNGAEPTKKSTEYSTPIKIEKTVTLSAKTFLSNGRESHPIKTELILNNEMGK